MTTNNNEKGPAKSLDEAKARIKNRDRAKIKANTNMLKTSRPDYKFKISINCWDRPKGNEIKGVE